MLGYNDKPLCRVYMEGVVIGDDRQCLLSVVDIFGFQKEAINSNISIQLIKLKIPGHKLPCY